MLFCFFISQYSGKESNISKDTPLPCVYAFRLIYPKLNVFLISNGTFAGDCLPLLSLNLNGASVCQPVTCC